MMRPAHYLALAMTFAVVPCASVPAQPQAQEKPAPLAFDNPISNIPGKSLLGVVVNYPPGSRGKPHRHAPSAFITAYVLEGAIRSQVDDGPVRVYHAGEYFIEKPGAHHMISDNASQTEPAKMLAIFVLDTGQRPLSMPLQSGER